MIKQYVTLDKRSKKAQKEYHAKQRRTWGAESGNKISSKR